MKPFLTAEWKNLIMFNYAAEPQALMRYLPSGTEIDTWNGTCYISIVGFMFLNTSVKGLSLPAYRNFEEVNLRFYVRFNDAGEWKRGVVFVKEIVPKRLISFIANNLYGEHYYCHPMRNYLQHNETEIKVKYEWKFNGEWNGMEVAAEKHAVDLQEGSEEEFITEHFWGYTRLASGNTSEYHVQHPRWQIHKVTNHHLFCNTELLYGKHFLPYLQQPPLSVFLADGSAVSVYPRKVWRY